MTDRPLLDALSGRPTRLGRLRDAVLLDPARRRLAAGIVPLAVTLLAAVLRLWDLGHPHELAFDERYYVKDAWSLWTLGYEGRWEEGANELLPSGDTGLLGTDASFIVHPPLGKWIIALGMGLLGPGSSVGWRLTTALLGVATVLVLYFLTLALTRSIAWAGVAGTLLAIDGVTLVLSRMALLDGILAFFLVLGVWFVVLDRQRTLPLLTPPGPDEPPPAWGPVLWRRPWLLAAGVALGAACAVKWSGLYALAALGLYVVATDALARRRAGVLFWPTDAVVRQGPVSFLLLVPVAALTYLVSWTGWLVTEGGYDRGSAANPLVALWNYHRAMYNFHVGLASGHPYESPAWQWPLLMRPTAFWVGEDTTECLGGHCIAVISSVPNPVIWWGACAASVYLVYRLVRGFARRAPMPWILGVPLVGIAMTWVPWLLYPERTIFQFYTVAIAPFLVLALALVLREIAGRRDDPLHRRQSGERTVGIFLVVAVLVSMFFYPVWTGMTVPYEFWRLHNWLPTWV